MTDKERIVQLEAERDKWEMATRELKDAIRIAEKKSPGTARTYLREVSARHGTPRDIYAAMKEREEALTAELEGYKTAFAMSVGEEIKRLGTPPAKLEAGAAALREALEWISKTTLRLIKTPLAEAEPIGCYCQIGRIAADALEDNNAGKQAAEVLRAAEIVGRLNYDESDSIRPMTNGAQDALHRLEDAVIAWVGRREAKR